MKEILKYIQLYTGCNEHALKRIELMLEQKMQGLLIKKSFEPIVPIINKPTRLIEKWAEDYFKENNLTYKQLINKSRKSDVVDARYQFIKSAHLNGYTCTTIGRYIKRDHSTILYAINS